MTDPSFGVSNRFYPDHIFIICPTLKVDNSYKKEIIPALE
jgi:hypothetical protein